MRKVNNAKADGKVVLAGWVHELRLLGKLAFIKLRDRSGIIQVVVKEPELLEVAKKLGREYIVSVEGETVESKQAVGGKEVIASKLEILNTAAEHMPVDIRGNVHADLDTRLDARAVDLRNEKVGALFEIRNGVFAGARNWFSENEYFEVNTPKIIKAAAEGGATLFKLDYFGSQAYLSQSPQLYKEILTSSFEKVYEIGPFFRAEPSDTSRHISEFVGIDIEAAFLDEQEAMDEMENVFWGILEYVKMECKGALDILERKLDFPKPPYKRITYDEALKKVEPDMKIEWGEDIGSEAEKILGEKMKDPFFIHHYPTDSKPFYIMPEPESPKVCKSFDFDVGGLEVASGGMRIHKREELENSLKSHGLKPADFSEHLKFFDWGMPPHSGWGSGGDRLAMVIAGVDNVRECILFPRDLRRLSP